MSVIHSRGGSRLLPLLLVGALALAGCDDPKVVAEVGKSDVSRADVAAFIHARSARARPTPSEALDALVERTLLAEEARRTGLGNDEALKARLRTAERELLAQALLDQRLAAATTDAELRKRYEASRDSLAKREVHVRQLMVRMSPGADEESRQRAQSRMNGLFARLTGGESFEKVAREASEDEVSAARGGDMGPVLEDQVDPVFFTEAARLKQGERSRPFATPYGLHLLEAVEPVKTVVPTFEQIRGRLEADARREAQERLVEELRKQIRVKTHPERLEALEATGGMGQPDGGQRP
ncbi:peptidylprolyl isomerase [Pyxidicoccus parkwayensis]|uniref:Peptidylprolyl isomerase n=1 Tax=Pyxidicoccus parkwayensis TaxID=2813578 RepID=A0ABX7P7Z7_9BACT|nr:peptidylprolyl isomerase [Pyxidicoccus parkwaysis]QSQ26564.1 peptidylprolyl isomerase [Pyxidicoccus parkwaysis]